MKSRSTALVCMLMGLCITSGSAWGAIPANLGAMPLSYQVVFSGRFQWRASASEPASCNGSKSAERCHAPVTMEVVISRAVLNAAGTHPDDPIRDAKAEIRSIAKTAGASELEASCSIGGIEAMDDNTTAVDLSCRSARLGALIAPVTLFIQSNGQSSAAHAKASGEHPAFVRFGTWMQGYEQAKLSVEINRASSLIKKPVRRNSSKDALKIAEK